MFTDQALEHQIKDLKKHGGMVGLSQDEAALDRLITITPHLAELVNLFLDGFTKSHKSTNKHDHHQLFGNTAVRVVQNAMTIRDSVLVHNGCNQW